MRKFTAADLREFMADLRKFTADLRDFTADLPGFTADLLEFTADLLKFTAGLLEFTAGLCWFWPCLFAFGIKAPLYCAAILDGLGAGNRGGFFCVIYGSESATAHCVR